MSLQMKYFVLKPASKDADDINAKASRAAMRAYADVIDEEQPYFAEELLAWIETEERVFKDNPK